MLGTDVTAWDATNVWQALLETALVGRCKVAQGFLAHLHIPAAGETCENVESAHLFERILHAMIAVVSWDSESMHGLAGNTTVLLHGQAHISLCLCIDGAVAM